MKSLIAFWNQDIINKLIVIVLLALIFGGGSVVFLIVKMPQGRSLGDAMGELFPSITPTFDMNSLLTKSALTSGPRTSTPIPTFFLLTFTPSPIFVPSAVPSPSPAITLSPTLLPVLLTNTVPPDATSLPLSSLDGACIPANKTNTGKIVEVLDGNTVRVLMEDGLIYVVRYIGVAVPEDKRYMDAARLKNIELAYGKVVTLIQDSMPKDDRGRLLRYVITGDVFINRELIIQGWGTASGIPPNSSCAQVLADAEQSARTLMIGMWKLPTP